MATSPISSWAAMVKIESRLAEIVAEAKAICDPDLCDYERLKQRISHLVGFSARNERLRSSQSYDIASRKLLDALGI